MAAEENGKSAAPKVPDGDGNSKDDTIAKVAGVAIATGIAYSLYKSFVVGKKTTEPIDSSPTEPFHEQISIEKSPELKEFESTAQGKAGEFADSAKDFKDSAGAKRRETVGGIKGGSKDALSAIQGAGQNAASTIQGAGRDALSTIKGAGRDTSAGIKGAGQDASANVKGAGRDASSGVKGAFLDTSSAVQGAGDDIKFKSQEAANAAKGKGEDAKGWLSGAGNKVKQGTSDGLEKGADALEEGKENVAEKTEETKSSGWGWFKRGKSSAEKQKDELGSKAEATRDSVTSDAYEAKDSGAGLFKQAGSDASKKKNEFLSEADKKKRASQQAGSSIFDKADAEAKKDANEIKKAGAAVANKGNELISKVLPGGGKHKPWGKGGEYGIVRGDTLYSISKRYGVTIGELQTANGIFDVDYIVAGDTLTIPK